MRHMDDVLLARSLAAAGQRLAAPGSARPMAATKLLALRHLRPWTQRRMNNRIIISNKKMLTQS
jgi:hypothetical protein